MFSLYLNEAGYMSPIVKPRKEVGLYANIHLVQETWEGRVDAECYDTLPFPLLDIRLIGTIC